MTITAKRPKALFLLGIMALPMPAMVHAQDQSPPEADVSATVYGTAPEAATEGPEVSGFISARNAEKVQVTSENGTKTVIAVNADTKITASKGLFGLGKNKLSPDQLLNGVPVTVKTMQSGGELFASQITMQNKDLKTAAMIRNGTEQGFAEQTAATEALRGRMGDIDKYNIKSTTNVNFDTGKAVLSGQAKADLCAAATTAQGTDNALLLVVGYTDSTGSEDVNQALSEKRASKVVNYLQQVCGWKPYRMLSPTGMATADPLADNSTPEGKAQNRRVAVNVLVSKAVDGI